MYVIRVAWRCIIDSIRFVFTLLWVHLLFSLILLPILRLCMLLWDLYVTPLA